MNLQETIRIILREELNEVRVPRSERVELYKDDNIIVVVPLTHRALQKYATNCQWCINDDSSEWKHYHQGRHAVIIQRNPKKEKIGITGNPTASEIFLLAKWDNNQTSFEDVCQMLDYEFRNDRTMSDYYVTISNDINNFATNIVYYSPENGVYDMEDNFLWNFNIEINDIPNVKPKVIEIMDDYLQKEETNNIQESTKRILREELNYTNKSVNIGDIYEESDIYSYIQKLHYKRDYDFWEGNLGERIEKFPYYIVKEVPIKDIQMDEYQLDEDDMEEYIEMFKERGSYPPIVLGKKSYGYYNIIDGTHRANALRELGFDKIICFVGKKKI